MGKQHENVLHRIVRNIAVMSAAYLDILLADNGVIRIHEITPFLYRQALLMLSCDGDKPVSDITKENWDTVFNAIGMVSIIKKGAPTESEQETIKSRFFFVNRAFFVEETGNTSRKTLLQAITDIEKTCAGLSKHHNGDVWQFGWSYFMACIESHKENSNGK